MDPALPAGVARPANAPPLRTVAHGDGWRVSAVTCRLGPQDRPFEERHDQVSIAAVIEGTFQYRSAAGTALLYPGAFMLGNPGTCYECGHQHGIGDRCLAFHYTAEYFEEIAHGAVGSAKFRFSGAMLPALETLAAPLLRAQTLLREPATAGAEEAVIGLAEAVLKNLSGDRGRSLVVPARDQRRISAVLRHIEERADAALDLRALADAACMSRYHFLRTFRRVSGMTPHQFLIGVRLRRAAARLRASSAPVAAIAFDAGFGDLSSFNARFRAAFGVSPGAYRRAA